MDLSKKSWLFVVPVSLLLVFPAFAQTQVPKQATSGVVEKNLEEKVQTPSTSVQREQVFQQLEFPQTALQMEEGKALDVKSFNITGNTLFKTKALKRLVAKYAKPGAHFNDLLMACDQINAFYREKGFFLTRAILPAQEIKDGVVSIQIVEGRLGQVVVQGGKFYKADFIKKHFVCAQKGIFNYNELMRSLVILNEYPDLQVKAVLKKGQEPFTTDIFLTVEDKRPFHTFVDYNNAGSRYVSTHRAGAGVEYSNLIAQGDKMSLRGVSGSPARTQGYASASYELPINSYGTKASFSYQWSEFNVGREYRRLNAGGNSVAYNLSLTHPLKRTLTSSMDVLLGFDYKNLDNFLLGAETSKDRLRIANFGITGDFLEKSLQGRDYYKIIFSQGCPSLWGGDSRNNPVASREGAGSFFFRSNIELGRYQSLPWDMILLTKGRTQMASDVLPASEQFDIGGVDTVRGFPSSEHLGDTGSVLNAELTLPPFFGAHQVPFLHKTLKEFMRIVGCIDYGITYAKNPQPGEAKSNEITGAGVGVRLDFGHDLNAKVDVGFPIAGDEPSSGDHAAVYVQVIKTF
ncbi:MAG: ShlB/FhaC/HecB family hemolysin secretion/activation protein [Candidatus Omnitrophica bacterium]|nr:ShlB/FhaC/HecB family hemolysin secretion/activation protein [Candidatus Omnitrophota bacterium]